jgi:hypothetical protein
MRKGKIFEEFDFLKQRYGLDDLALFVQRDSPFLPHPSCDAVYLAAGDLILLRRSSVNKYNLKYLLHEMCHAIQHKENRLKVPRNYYHRYYAREIEAELFAIVEYNKLYADTHGYLDKNFWELASYNDYKRFASNDFCEGTFDLMTPEEVYMFVKRLKGKDKKDILKRLNRKIRRTRVEMHLSRICL